MQLQELRELVGNLGDYKPDTDAYYADIDKLINNTYTDVFDLHPWPWAQREAQVTAYADVTLVDASMTVASKTVTAASAPFLDWMEGQVFEVGGTEYEIAQVSSTGTLYLTTAYTGAINAVLTAVIKHRYVNLPSDVVSIMQVGTYDFTGVGATQGRLIPLTRYEGEHYTLSYAQTGTPSSWLPADPLTLRAPARPPTLGTAVGVAWPAGEYSILLGYTYQNRYSPPCATAVVHVSDGVTATVPTLSAPTTGTGSGYRRVVYLKGPGYDAYRFYLNNQTEGLLALTLNTPPDLGTWEFTSRMPAGGGTYQRIRLHPRQATDTQLTVRYIRRPALLIEEGDAPEFPEPDHHVIAEMALTEVYAKADQLPQSKVYQLKATRTLTRMEAQYLSVRPRRWVKQGWTSGVVDGRPLRTITHI